METEQSANNQKNVNEKEYFEELIIKLKSFNMHNPEYFKTGDFIDIMDDSRNWCVGQITERNDNIITVHYEGCHFKNDEVVSLKRTMKYNLFRRLSRGYSGLKKTAIRSYTYNQDDVKEIQKEIKYLTETKFSQVNDALYFTQLFRGKIFTYMDIFMTTTYNSKDQTDAIPHIHNLLCEYINMSVEYFNYYKENLYIVNTYLIKHKDLFLIDPKCAVLASINEVVLTLKRILGEDPRVSEYYKLNEEIIKKLYANCLKKSSSNQAVEVPPCANCKAKICIDKAYKPNFEYNKIPAILISSMIDYFYEKGGFAAMWEILLPDKFYSANKSTQLISVHFDTIEIILNFFQLYKIIIDLKSVFPDEISYFKTYFTSRIMNLSESEIKEVRKGIIINTIRYLSLLIPFEIKVQKLFFEELYLTYHYKCLTSKNLEKRIAGITAVNLIIDTIERKESRADPSPYSYSNFNNPNIKIDIDENIEMTDSKGLISFFKDKNFLDVFLGEKIHEEIIKRSVSIFRLLAKKNSYANLLNDNIYDLIWKNYEEKHESIANQLENIICDISLFISDKDKFYLFSKIKSYAEKISFANHENRFSADSNFFSAIRKIIEFIKNFTENCLKKINASLFNVNYQDINDEKLYGLPLLWKYMLDSTYGIETSRINAMITDYPKLESNQDSVNSILNKNISKIVELVELTSESIANLLNQETSDIDVIKEKFLFMCFENVKNNCSVVQSMNMIRKILQQFPNHKSKKYVRSLDEKFSIIDLILINLERYLIKSREIKSVKIHDENINSIDPVIRTNANLIDNNGVMIEIYEGCYSHRINIEARLNLIYFFSNEQTDRGRLILSPEHLMQLWKLLVINTKDECEKDLFFESICKNCEFFDESITEYLFIQIFLNKDLFDYKKFNFISYDLFQKLFYAVNISNKKIVHDGRKYRIQVENIVGLDTFYQIICEVEDISVRNKFVKLLSQLFTEFKLYLEEFCIRFWKKGVEKILEILSSAFETKNDMAIKGIVTFIKNLIQEFENISGEIPQQDDVYFTREGIDYTFFYPDRNESRTIKIGKNELTYEIRYRIAYFFDIHINCLKLRSKQRLIELNDDFKLFVDICPNYSAIEIKEGTNPILGFKNNYKKMLVNDSNMNKILYELLHNSRASYIQDVWELINILPKNVELEEEIYQIGKNISQPLDMNKYFDEQSIYVMSYSLKLIKSIIFNLPRDNEPKNNNSSSNPIYTAINKEWIQNFYNNKGLAHLLKLVLQFNVEHFSSDLGFECLNDLIYILRQFIEVTNCFENQVDILIAKIFRIIPEIIQSSIKKDTSPKFLEMHVNFKKRREREFSTNENTNDNINLTTNNFTELNRNVAETEFCEEVLKIFNSEDATIRKLLEFLDNIAARYKDPKNIYSNLFISSKDVLKEVVTTGLICSKNYKIKITLKNFFKRILDLLSFEDKDMARTFKSIIFQLMLNKDVLLLANKYQETCSYFFKILSFLLEEFLEPFTVNTNLDFSELADFMIDAIINKDSTEVYHESDDNVLEGYLMVLRVLIIKSRELSEKVNKNYNLIDLILNKCLLSKCQVKSTIAPFPKCKTPSSRESAYKLLTALSYNNPDVTLQIINVLNNYHMLGYWKSKRIFDWKISLSNDEKSSTGYVGLKNLGCTCYMNSLIQQFFMIPQLRESLLASPDSKLTEGNVTKPENSSLYQIKSIFASLKAYDAQFYNPKDFCMNFDGNVLDIKEQMDVDEFYNTLIDKLENHTKNTRFQNLFKHFFGFTISDEFICKGCPHYSEREQYFNSIQLQVLNKKTITESLKSYIEGELLEGDNAYYCDKCDKKVNTLKRQCIKRLPRILIVVLKRFEFDYENMVKIKVNEYLEFPHQLNMEPYTQEYLQKLEKLNKNHELVNNLTHNQDKNENNYGDDNMLVDDVLSKMPDNKISITNPESNHVSTNPDNPRVSTNPENGSISTNSNNRLIPTNPEDIPNGTNNNLENMNQDNLSQNKKSELSNTVSRPNDYYLYNLSGVVIHSGTSENGHYYSIIKDHNKNNWYEFNDTNVKDYDIKDLSNEAFGGSEIIYKDNKKETVEKNTNAYLLFYIRQFEEEESEEYIKVNIPSEDTYDNKSEYNQSEGKSNEVIITNAIEKGENKIIKQQVIKEWNKYSNISPSIMDCIDLDNFQYWVSKILFSPEYHSFITDLLINSNLSDIAILNYPTKNDNKEIFDYFFLRNNNTTALKQTQNKDIYEIEMQVISSTSQDRKIIGDKLNNLNIDPSMIINPNNQIDNDFEVLVNNDYEFTLFKFACLFFVNVLIRSRDKNYLPALIDWLKAMINKNSLYANWILEEFSNQEIITEYLIDPPLSDIKKMIVGLLYCAMISSYKSCLSNYDDSLNNIIQKNEPLTTFLGNIMVYMIKNTDKDISSIFYLIYRFSVLGSYSRLFLFSSGFLHFMVNFYLNVVTYKNPNSITCFTNPINALGYIQYREYTPTYHKELDQKLMNRMDKLTAWEELTEKKFSERFATQRSDFYLLMTFSEIVTNTNINFKHILDANHFIKLDPELQQILQFNNPDFIRCLIYEAKSRQAATSLSKVLNHVSTNNLDNSNTIQKVILDIYNTMDTGEFENVLIIFKKFILEIDDSLKEARIKSSLLKFLQIVMENTRYWSFMDSSIDFLIKLFLVHSDVLKNYVDPIKESLAKITRYLKENPSPPTMMPNKNQVMYKRRQVMFPNKISQFQINAFNTKYINIANDKISKIREIYNSNI